jgi:hypothetical protein
MKTTLIFLGSLAVVLGIFAYFAVFGAPTGSYAVNPLASATDTAPSLVLVPIASSTIATATAPDATASSSSPTASAFSTAFSESPLTWPESQAKISITALALEGNQMTFTFGVQAGAATACIPLNLRLVADESGDLDPPNPSSFSFPDSGNCNGAAGQTYANQTTTFTIDPANFPLLFTTGGASNIFFEVVTTTNNGLNIDFPGTSG